ncbi:TetR/AcrR family transcriptional regulator [Kitasatospora sp. NBC_01539]|uniref:TetR/AcrR family transcriptional regulator n=1 Tax=Kitasatospora sp. NBC_01539 TaxID=2903577 RepID=UPI00386010E1
MPDAEPTPPAANPTEKPARTRRRTGTYAAADDRRRRIVEAAMGHFAERGYLNASMQKIAADVGISYAGLLHHFGNKRELLRTVLEVRELQAVELFYSRLDLERPDLVQLLGLICEHTAFNLTQPGLMQMYTLLSAEATAEDHPAHAYFRERYARITALIEKAAGQGVSSGALDPGTDGTTVARELLAVADGFQIQWGLSDGTWDMLGAYRNYLDRLCRRLTADGSGLGE